MANSMTSSKPSSMPIRQQSSPQRINQPWSSLKKWN